MVPKNYVTWQQVDDFVNEVVSSFKDKQVPGVFGLPRGGLVMAVMISNRLNIPMLMAPVAGCIIVDDICDTGESLIHYVKNSSGERQQYTIATLFYKENDFGIVPDYYGLIKGKEWIVFPWEEQEG